MNNKDTTTNKILEELSSLDIIKCMIVTVILLLFISGMYYTYKYTDMPFEDTNIYCKDCKDVLKENYCPHCSTSKEDGLIRIKASCSTCNIYSDYYNRYTYCSTCGDKISKSGFIAQNQEYKIYCDYQKRSSILFVATFVILILYCRIEITTCKKKDSETKSNE